VRCEALRLDASSNPHSFDLAERSGSAAALIEPSGACLGSDGLAASVTCEHVAAKGRKTTKAARHVPGLPSSDDPHAIVFFKRHADDDPGQAAPGHEFLSACPPKVEATMYAVLAAVAAAPPKRFAGGGLWEAMHGDMAGWFEVRVDGARPRIHHRLFCRMDYEAVDADKPLLVVVTGLSKAIRTVFSDSDYSKVRALGDEYFDRNPRSHL
jgi:hypothetical protein